MQRKMSFVLLASCVFVTPTLAQSNIDVEQKFAWGENIAWTNWRDASGTGDGVVVNETFLSGYIWGENVGWVNVGNGPVDGETYANIDDTDFGVNIAPNGDLSGLAWAENIGWINFDTSGVGSDRARFDDSQLRFRGYVWGENAGWINLEDTTHFVVAKAIGPIPTVSEWGLVAMTLLVLGAGTVVLMRRRSVAG